jgi:CRP/FNR family transcriptional regulator, cyclic AMP receptor protein
VAGREADGAEMSERGIAELLGETAVFAGMRPDQLDLIAGCGRITPFEAGERLFREGDSAETFWLLRHGRVALELYMPGRGAMTVSTHGPGEVVGWSWLFPPYRWHLDGRAVDHGSAVAFDGACLRGKADADHELGYELMKRFAARMVERLQATRVQLLDVYGHVPAG